MISCLDNNPKNRPIIENVSTIIMIAKDGCSNSITPAAWWAEESMKQDRKQEEQQQVRPQQQVCNK